MDIALKFEAAKKTHLAAPSYSTYSALANLAEKSGAELNLKLVNVGVLRNFTVEPLLPLLSGEMALAGQRAKIYTADFDTIAENVFNPQSGLYESRPDLIMIFQWLELLSPALTTNFLSHSSSEIEEEIQRVIHLIDSFFEAIRSRSNATVLLNNFQLPLLPTLGILDAQSERYHTYSIMKLNLELLKVSKKYSGIYWVDYLGLFARHGLANIRDEKHWQMSKAPFSRSVLNSVASEYGKFFKSFAGRSKKCLVLDCDNTLWGGIIGEDGIKGLKLGGSYPGQVFKDFQQEILNLYHRGVILALCSKNNEDDVLEVLDKHPEMLLKKKHFATWQINWSDKASNIEQIAKDLNIGIDSLVFVDDNPFECNWVREKLPEVAVVELGKEVLEIKKKLQLPGFFDSLVFSAEDKKRNEMYASDKQRKELMGHSGSIADYLKSLEIKTAIGIASELEIPRVAQMTQKTNQFNLTTKRYSESDITGLSTGTDSEVYILQLQDKISDLGIVGVAIVRFENTLAVIDTLLLSCRALSRGAEDTLLALILNRAKLRDCKKVNAEYLKTAKNAQVKDFYQKHHFTLLTENESGSKWELNLETHQKISKLYPTWIQINPLNGLEVYSKETV